MHFIFFLTYNDVTVDDALAVFEEIRDTDVDYIGFKDVGLPKNSLGKLREMIADTGKQAVLEVVSTTKEENLRSAKMGVQLGVDYLIGGTYIAETLPLVEGTDIRYFPYVGTVIGHPCLLRGSIEEIAEEAKRAEAAGIDGIDLLAYRYDGNPVHLVKEVMNTVSIPLIIAGSINDFERIARMKALGAWAFTIGSAIFDRRFRPDGTIQEQIAAVLQRLNQ
jgi:NAD(P)H-dependent flavin oxidoreductase YrpB (nitropropane dioxygenase family)